MILPACLRDGAWIPVPIDLTKTLIMNQCPQAAEEDLVRLRDLSPSEPNVVLLLGKVYRLQGKTMLASRVLAVARDLDPRNAPKIAKLIEETGRGRGTAAGGRGSVGVAHTSETSIEGPSTGAVDVSMEGSLEGT
jgi:hypothetical protein